MSNMDLDMNKNLSLLQNVIIQTKLFINVLLWSGKDILEHNTSRIFHPHVHPPLVYVLVHFCLDSYARLFKKLEMFIFKINLYFLSPCFEHGA